MIRNSIFVEIDRVFNHTPIDGQLAKTRTWGNAKAPVYSTKGEGAYIKVGWDLIPDLGGVGKNTVPARLKRFSVNPIRANTLVLGPQGHRLIDFHPFISLQVKVKVAHQKSRLGKGGILDTLHTILNG